MAEEADDVDTLDEARSVQEREGAVFHEVSDAKDGGARVLIRQETQQLLQR